VRQNHLPVPAGTPSVWLNWHDAGSINETVHFSNGRPGLTLITKGFSMRKLAVSLMLLLFVLATGAIHARVGFTGTLQVNLPFAFTVSNKNFPAGNYKFEQPTGARQMSLRSVDGKVGEVFDTISMRPKSVTDQTGSYLIFHRYGEKYFLQFLYIGHMGYEFPASGAEKEMQEGGTEPVVVTVRIRKD
jgi:hypothetical protein